MVLPTCPTISIIPETMAPAPDVSPRSWKLLDMLVKPAFSMVCPWGIMEIVGLTNMSNNFHASRNYGSGSRGFSKFMEVVGNVGKTSPCFVCGESWEFWFYQHVQQCLRSFVTLARYCMSASRMHSELCLSDFLPARSRCSSKHIGCFRHRNLTQYP